MDISGATVHLSPSSFGMLLANDITGLLKGASDAVSVAKLPKVKNALAEDDTLRVDRGWLWAGKKLVQRVISNETVKLDAKSIRTYVTVDGEAKYAIVNRGQHNAETIYYAKDKLPKGNFFIKVGNVAKSEKIKAAGTIKMGFMFDPKTKAIVAFDPATRKAYGIVDVSDRDKVIVSKFEETDYSVIDIDVIKGQMLLKLVNSVCEIDTTNAAVKDSGHIYGLKVVGKTPLF